MKIGFTGTQVGTTDAQWRALYDELQQLQIREVHHGDCIGADAEFHDICYSLLNVPRVVIHPPVVHAKRAFCFYGQPRIFLEEAKGYLDRNHDIVDATDILVACPKEIEEQLRSGTWATVRYAQKKRKPIMYIMPDGAVIRERAFPPVLDL